MKGCCGGDHVRIGIAFRTFHEQSGLPRYCVELARQLARTDDVYLFARTVDTPVPARGVVRFPFSFHSKRIEYGPNTLVNSALLSIGRRALNLDVVNTQGAELLGFDVITAHGTWWGHYRSHATLNPTLAKELRKSVMPIVERAAFGGRRFRRVIAVSQLTRRELREKYEVPDDRIVVIPEGVDPERFRPDSARRQSWRQRMGYGEELILLHVTTDFVRKGLRTIIQALPHVDSDTRLVVVGNEDPNPYLDQAKKLGVEHQIRFTGRAETIEDFYAGADAFVFPSHYEAFGLAVLEAMASGLTVICTRGLGVTELLADGKDCLMLDAWDDPLELAERIQNVHAGGTKRLGAEARRTAELHSWARTAASTREVYEACLRR